MKTDNKIETIEIKVDEIILYLEKVLDDLSCYVFDDEINNILIKLGSIVKNKLYSDLNLSNKEILDYEIIFRLSLTDFK